MFPVAAIWSARPAQKSCFGGLLLRCSIRAALFPDRPPDPVDVAAVAAWMSAQLESKQPRV